MTLQHLLMALLANLVWSFNFIAAKGVVHFSLMFMELAVSSDVSSVAIANQLYVPFSIVLAVLFGVTVWGDTLTPELLIGGALTLIGVAIIVLRSSRKLARARP